MPGMGDFRRTHTCLNSLLQFVKFSPFPSSARKTELVFKLLAHIDIYIFLTTAGSWCLCVLSSIQISQHSKFLQLWLRKNYFALEKKLDRGSLQLLPTRKGVAVLPKTSSARTGFFQDDLSSVDITKKKKKY